MLNLVCVACGVPLAGGVDTFGWPGQELCQDDFLAMADEGRRIQREKEAAIERHLQDLRSEYNAQRSALQRESDMIAACEIQIERLRTC